MHDASGRVTLHGFYEGVGTPHLAQLAQWRALEFDVATFLGAVGLSTPAGEEGMSVIEQLWSRPTAEINGIFGGYTGPGTKTVIPSHATAKLSFRLVPKAAASALEQEWGKPVAIIGCRASIPIVESFRSRLGMDSLLVGFALDDDRIHASN